MRLIVVSGLSGSGKSIALHVLEDIGYYCIDNLPAGLLAAAVRDIAGDPDRPHLLAVGIDARNRSSDIASLPGQIANFRERDIQTDVIFLQADDEVLLKRFGETRRRHPLSESAGQLRAAIDAERNALAEIVNAADLIIDTSTTSVYELADTIRDRIDRRRNRGLSVVIESFGYKNGIPADADFVFDLRCLPNPYWTMSLRGQTGLDPEVQDFLSSHDNFNSMHDDVVEFLERWIPVYTQANRRYLTVALGCTGGQHRSVYMTERVAESLSANHDDVQCRHHALRGSTEKSA